MRTCTLVVAALTVLGLTSVTGPLNAQTSVETVRLTRTHPMELMVDLRTGTTTVELRGENINAGDVMWTWRLYRYHVRRTGETGWRRLYIHPQGSWYEDERHLQPLLANGSTTGWTASSMTLELPNQLYFQSAGTLEFKVEKGEWKAEGLGANYIVGATSNILRVPIRPTPTEAPVVTRVDPSYVPVLGRGVERAVITVHGQNLMPGAQATVGTEPCEVTRADPASGWLQCSVPGALQSRAGMYLVGVSTANGGARTLGRLTVQAPLELARPSPTFVPVADSTAAVIFAYTGGAPLSGRVRTSGTDWATATLASSGTGRVRVEIPSSLTRRPGAIEFELRNAAGPALATLLVCGPGGEQPRGCPLSVASSQPQRPQTAGARAAATPPTAERTAAVVDPRDPVSLRPQPEPPGRDAVSLRPQPEPPGLVSLPLASTATLRLDDGRSVAWRRVGGATRLVLLDRDGKSLQVFGEGSRLVRDGTGRVYVRVANGVVPMGRVRQSR
jgi:hypothetical protein